MADWLVEWTIVAATVVLLVVIIVGIQVAHEGAPVVTPPEPVKPAISPEERYAALGEVIAASYRTLPLVKEGKTKEVMRLHLEQMEAEYEELSNEIWRRSLIEIPAPGLQGTEMMMEFSHRGPANLRRVDIHGIKHRDEKIYLAAFCLRTKEERTFGIDGIRRMVDPVTEEEWPTLQAWLAAKGIPVDWSLAKREFE